MKIAFWSSARGSCGVTSNMACISIASALKYSYKSLLIENHYQKNRLGNILMYHWANYKEQEEYYHFKHIGMEYILSQISAGRIDINIMNYYAKFNQSHQDIIYETSKAIEEASMEILYNYLYYIPTGTNFNKEIFDYNLYGNIKNILDASEEFADITYIDTSNEDYLSSKIILEEVDLVVVNLNQNSNMIKNFFDNYSSILNKCVFLISSYNKNSKFNLDKISKKHFINKSNIAVIPYNVEYQEAVSQGSVVEFLYHNFSCKRISPNYHFIKEVKKAVTMIFNNLESMIQREECYEEKA